MRTRAERTRMLIFSSTPPQDSGWSSISGHDVLHTTRRSRRNHVCPGLSPFTASRSCEQVRHRSPRLGGPVGIDCLMRHRDGFPRLWQGRSRRTGCSNFARNDLATCGLCVQVRSVGEKISVARFTAGLDHCQMKITCRSKDACLG